MKKNTSAKMIKKAIDSYPGGICFSALDGRVILANEKMNQADAGADRTHDSETQRWHGRSSQTLPITARRKS